MPVTYIEISATAGNAIPVVVMIVTSMAITRRQIRLFAISPSAEVGFKFMLFEKHEQRFKSPPNRSYLNYRLNSGLPLVVIQTVLQIPTYTLAERITLSQGKLTFTGFV